MPQIVLVIIVSAALLMSIIIMIYVLFSKQNSKKDYFLPMQALIVVYLFGYLLEITSNNIEEAYVGARLLYSSVSFVITFVFFFIADYCEIELPQIIVKTPMMIVSMAMAVTLWIARVDSLLYTDYSYDASLAHHLNFAPGPLYYLLHSYLIICMVLSAALLVYRMKIWKEKYRKQLIVLLVCLILPFTTEVLYFITGFSGININYVYLTPYSMAVMSFCLYMGVVRFNIFDIISMSTISAMDYIRDGFVLLDDVNNYLFSNPAASMFFPGIKKLVRGESIFTVESLPEELRDMNIGSFVFSTDRDTRHFKASVSPVFSHNKTFIAKIVLFNDTTESVMLMKHLEDAAYLDALTGIYNRKHFFELARVNIERALRLINPLYTAMLDLDFFKKVNDTYGHTAGDMVLAHAAEVISHTIRSYDLLGRYGGEEFILLITGSDMTETSQIMERIRANMENTVINYGDIEIQITCSIGLAKWRSGETLENSVKKADDALYTAKRSGRNQVRIYDGVQ